MIERNVVSNVNVIKKYEIFEKDVDPALAKIGSRKIIQYGFPGSGSTFVWQVLDFLFSDVRKTHECPELDKDAMVIATVRDFRDVLCTYLGRADLPPTQASIEFIARYHAVDARSFTEINKVSATWAEQPNILWLRYEDFFNQFDYLFAQIETFFGIEITAEKRSAIKNLYSRETNLERMKSADALCKQNGASGWLDKDWQAYVVDGINGNHITSTGEPGKWKRIIPADLHDYVNEVLEEPLKKFGYM